MRSCVRERGDTCGRGDGRMLSHLCTPHLFRRSCTCVYRCNCRRNYFAGTNAQVSSSFPLLTMHAKGSQSFFVLPVQPHPSLYSHPYSAATATATRMAQQELYAFRPLSWQAARSTLSCRLCSNLPSIDE
jgi:hypothetical protein